MRKCRTCEYIVIEDIGECGHILQIQCKNSDVTEEMWHGDCPYYEPYKGHSEQDIFRTWKEYWCGYD